MRDELNILEELFINCGDNYDSCEGWTEADFEITEIDIQQKLKFEFSKIKRYYLELESSGEPSDRLKLMFTARFNRLLKFKIILEEYLEGSTHELIIHGRKSGCLTPYNNFLAGYKGVIGLLSLIINDLHVSLDFSIESHVLSSKYEKLSSKQIDKWYDELRANYSQEQNSVIVDGMTIDTSDWNGSVQAIDLDEHREVIKKYTEQNSQKPFPLFMRDVHHYLRRYDKNSPEEIVLYENLNKTLSNLLERNNSEKEEDILNFLIETNVAELETYDFAIQKINQDLCDKSDSGKYEVLKSFQNRLNNLRYKPSYKTLNRSSIVALVNVTLSRLIEFVDKELTKYDSSKFDIKLTAISTEKIKTKLSVKKIGLLFRMLSDENLLEYDEVTTLTEQIAFAFSSKQKDDFSSDSIKNHFDTPKHDAIKFWEGVLLEMQKKLNKFKIKYD
ncbi:hypothetical protein ACXR6G_11140 [Ancylomarina sp. YFZ004]